MSKPKSPAAALVDQFARETGRPLRTARHHRLHKTPDWLAWVAQRGGELAPADSSASPSPSLSDPLSRSRSLEAAAWATLLQVEGQKTRAVDRKDTEGIVGWTAAWLQTLKAYVEARRDRERLELKTGATLTASDVARERAEFATAIREIFRAQPAEVGPQANPTNPQLAMRALQRWFAEKLQPLLATLADGQKIAEMPLAEGAGESGEQLCLPPA